MSDIIECLDGLTANQIIRRIAKTANGVPFYLQTLGAGAGFCDEYQRIYDDFVGIGVAPSDAIAEQQNIMVCGLIDDGVWAKLDIFYVYAAHANGGGEALMNWVTTGFFNGVAVNAPAFVALEGFTGGTNEYINDNWNPSTNGVNYIRNSASLGFYSRSNVAAEVAVELGLLAGAAQSFMTVKHTAGPNRARININSAAGIEVAPNEDSSGMFIGSRTASNVQKLYRNKAVLVNGTNISVAPPNEDLYSLALNNGGVPASFSTKQVSLAFAGGGFTQTDVDNMTDRFETYMDSNGKGVIP